jgi:hypothetical protein
VKTKNAVPVKVVRFAVSCLVSLCHLCPEVVVFIELPPFGSTSWAGVVDVVNVSALGLSRRPVVTHAQLSTVLAVRYALELGKSPETFVVGKNVKGAVAP